MFLKSEIESLLEILVKFEIGKISKGASKKATNSYIWPLFFQVYSKSHLDSHDQFSTNRTMNAWSSI